MAEAKKLVPGVDSPSPTPAEARDRVAVLRATVEKYLPDFVKAVAAGTDMLVLHQDAFAAGYHDDEYVLFGMALKYAGLSGREVMITGRNHSTF